MKARAAGEVRRAAARAAGLELSVGTLIGLEANAQTYAGHTTWNKLTQRATHEALISDAEADLILAQLDRRKTTRSKGAAYLLSGILVTPAGGRWHGDGEGFYRCGARRVKAETLERLVLQKLTGDLASQAFADKLLERSRELARPREREAELRELQKQAAQLERKAARIRSVIAEMQHPQGMIRELDKLEAQKLELDRRAAAAAEVLAGDKVLLMITPADVRQVLADVAGGLVDADRECVKGRVRELLEQVTLEPAGLRCQLHYRIAVETGDIDRA